MKEPFKRIKFRGETLVKIVLCNDVIKRYQDQGLRLTLRQLYYQLVTMNVIPNEEKSYTNLSTVVSNARLAGIMDWDAIEDRVRRPRTQGEFRDLKELIEAAINAYRLPRWKGQDHYVELWVEKDALAGVLEPIARKFHVTMMVNRGYSSQSAMYESSKRFNEHDGAQLSTLFYLGDHDPSGEDMVRDIQDRLDMFCNYHVEVHKLALTMDQIEEYNPPPNPAKIKDPRAMAYIREHGNSSWEVDALPPEVLTEIIEHAFSSVLDTALMNKVIEQEGKDKNKLRRLYKKP